MFTPRCPYFSQNRTFASDFLQISWKATKLICQTSRKSKKKCGLGLYCVCNKSSGWWWDDNDVMPW